MKLIMIAICLSFSANILAQDSKPKLALCESDTIRFSFEFAHSYLPTPVAIKIEVPNQSKEFTTEAFFSALSPDDYETPTMMSLSAEGRSYATKKLGKAKLDGMFSFSVKTKLSESTASGKITFSSKKMGVNLKNQVVTCKIRVL